MSKTAAVTAHRTAGVTSVSLSVGKTPAPARGCCLHIKMQRACGTAKAIIAGIHTNGELPVAHDIVESTPVAPLGSSCAQFVEFNAVNKYAAVFTVQTPGPEKGTAKIKGSGIAKGIVCSSQKWREDVVPLLFGIELQI